MRTEIEQKILIQQSKKIVKGCQVKYRAEFLKNTGQRDYITSCAVGAVTQLETLSEDNPFKLVSVKWNVGFEGLPGKILSCNLIEKTAIEHY